MMRGVAEDCCRLIMLSLLLLSILGNVLLIDGQRIVNRTFIEQATTVGSSSVCVGSSQTFNCTIEAFIEGIGFAITNAIWSRNGSIITDSTPHHTLLRTQHGLQPVVTGLMVDDTTLDDNGAVYSCTADDAPDDFPSNVTLNVVEGLPSPFTSNKITDTSCLTTSVVVSWTLSSGDPVCGPISYNVTISPSDGVMRMIINDNSYNFTALTPGTSYTVTVTAINMAGAGNSSITTFYIISMAEAVPRGVTNLKAMPYFDLSTSTTNIEVTWDAAESPYCGEVLHYIVMISSDEHSNIMNDNVNVPVSSADMTMFSATFSNLRNDTNYIVAVTAVNREGAGVTTTIVNIFLPSPSTKANPAGGGGGGGLPIWVIIIIACIVGVFFIFYMASVYCILRLIEEDSYGREYNKPSCCGLFTFALFSCGISLLIWSLYRSCCREQCKEDKCCCKKDCCGCKKIKCIEIFFLICSLGLGYVMWMIYNMDCCHCCWRNNGKGSLVQPGQSMELEKQTDSTYDSPGIQKKDQTAKAAENQAVYSYARTGPVNVIVPGSANS